MICLTSSKGVIDQGVAEGRGERNFAVEHIIVDGHGDSVAALDSGSNHISHQLSLQYEYCYHQVVPSVATRHGYLHLWTS